MHTDLPTFLALDRFAFAMVGQLERADGFEHVRLRRVQVTAAEVFMDGEGIVK